MSKGATKTRALTLRAHEARRLAEYGRVLIVREMDAPTIGPNSGGPIREIVPSLLIGSGLWDVRYDGDNPRAVRCPFGPVGSELWGREMWAVEGLYTDATGDMTIQANPSHYTVWTRRQCFDGAAERFNLSHLGKWRAADSMPFWASRFPNLRLAACEVKRAGEATRADVTAMGLPDGPWRIVKPGSSPIEYMEIKPTDMLAGLVKLPADRWCWFATIERGDG